MGITSTEAITGDLNADSIPDLLTALGVLDNINDNPGGLSALEGIAVDRTSVLVKYTYWGDADFDGRVTFDDYDVTDYYYWFPPPPSACGWWTGDYDYDGGIDFDDYDLQDYAYWFQFQQYPPL
ncbi:MAG: hypothetical protein IMZ65_04000 [Planctomycetes bacterium]|nr:hypothetical protein [Planctomycetota bacterium]